MACARGWCAPSSVFPCPLLLRALPRLARRAYTGLSYPAVGVGSYGASPTVARPSASYGGGAAAAGLAPFSPQAPATAMSAPAYGDASLRLGMGMGGYVPQGAGAGAGAGGAGEAMAVRVHIQASPTDVYGTPAGGR